MDTSGNRKFGKPNIGKAVAKDQFDISLLEDYLLKDDAA
jgi:hypothetical protein